MIKRSKGYSKTELEEQVVQKFPHRCPYCDQPLSYDQFDTFDGETPIFKSG